MANCLVLTLIGFVVISAVKCDDQSINYVKKPGFIPDLDLSYGIYTMAKEFEVLGVQLNSLRTSPGIRRGICDVGFQGITESLGLETTGCNRNSDRDHVQTTAFADATEEEERQTPETLAKLVSADRTPVPWRVSTVIDTLRVRDLVTMNQAFERLTPDNPCSVNVTLQGTFFEFYEVSRGLWVHDTKATDDFRTRFIEDRVSVTGELKERDDALALFLIFQITAFSKLAQQQGLYFTWPALSWTFCHPPDSVNGDRSGHGAGIGMSRPDFEWHTGSWTPCSVPCGIGYATRVVYCSSKFGMIDPIGTACTRKQPATMKTCNLQSCGPHKDHRDNSLRDKPNTIV